MLGFFRRLKNKKGMTLIEMLVVFFIIIVITSTLFINYEGTEYDLSLERSAYKLAQDIRRVSEMAMASRQIEGEEKEIAGYGIVFNKETTNKKYNLYYYYFANNNTKHHFCQNDGGGGFIKTNIGGDIELEKGVIISSFDSDDGKSRCINFAPPAPDVFLLWGPGANQEITTEIVITLELENNPLKTKTVKVNKAGVVTIE